MNTQNCADPKNAVYEDLRHLISLSESAGARSRRIVRLRARIPAWLRKRRALLLAGCVSLVVAGASGLAIQLPMWRGSSARQTTLDRSRTPAIPAASQVATFIPPAGTPTAGGAFIIRVGSFRDRSNAERMAELLRQRTLNIRTEVVPASGLYVVTLGPFPQKGIADNIARSVQAVTGLAPQVVRQDF